MENEVPQQPLPTNEPKQEAPPEKKKRKKYVARYGVVCPDCGAGLRTCFYTLGKGGGVRAVYSHGVCVQCQSVYKLSIRKVPEVIG